MIVWADLETTGLDPLKGSILEIAMVATDDNFVQIGVPFVSLVKPLHLLGYEAMDDFVKKMHTKSGLLDRLYNIGALFHGEDPSACLLSELPRRGDVERAAIEWCYEIAGRDGVPSTCEVVAYDVLRKTPLGGNTVHFDKRWLIHHMSDLEALFSHRIYDVSSFTEEMKRSAPDVYAGRPGLGPDGRPVPMHRALDDITNSIETARYYRAARSARSAACPG